MFDAHNFNLRQTRTENVDVCFLYTEYLLCAMFTESLNCVSDLICSTTLVTVEWFSPSGFPHLDPEPRVSSSHPFSLACSEGAQQRPCHTSVTCSVSEPRATRFTVNFRRQIPKKYVHMS